MNRFEKVALVVFLIITAMTIFFRLWDFQNFESFLLLFVILVFNFSFFLLIVLVANSVAQVSQKRYPYFVFCLIISSLMIWYIVSSILKFGYGNFLSIGGVLFFVATRTFLWNMVALLVFGVLIFGFAGFFYFLTYKGGFIGGGFRKRKIFYVLVLIIVLSSIIFFVPKSAAPETSPLIDYFKGFIKPGYLDVRGNVSDFGGEEILNISYDGKPNVVFILLESLPAERIHYYGYERNVSPNIDNLARNGVVFMNARGSASHSDHAQPSYLSSRYTFTNNWRNFYDEDYPREFMWDILKREGYKTAFISSQDEDWANMINYYNKVNLDLFWHSLTDGEWDYGGGNARKDYDEKTIDRVFEWIDSFKNESDEKFFLYMNLQATHHPYAFPEGNSIWEPDEVSIFTNYFYISDGDEEASNNVFDNSIYYVDRQIGRLIDYLKEEGLYDETIIVLSADHGEVVEERHGSLRHGYGVFDEEIKVPLIFRIPDFSQVVEENVRTIDTIPTILKIMGLNGSKHFQGEVMRKGKPAFFYAQNQNSKLGILKDNIKYVLDLNTDLTEAYNLTSDPEELNNLIKSEEDEFWYAENYGYILFEWWGCQVDYYSERLWERGELIDCP